MNNQNWLLVKLGNLIIDMQTGFAQRPNNNKYGTPQIRTNNISPNGDMDLSDIAYVNVIDSDLAKYGVLRKDVIFNNTNSVEWVGKTAFFNLDKQYVLSSFYRILCFEKSI